MLLLVLYIKSYYISNEFSDFNWIPLEMNSISCQLLLPSQTPISLVAPKQVCILRILNLQMNVMKNY